MAKPNPDENLPQPTSGPAKGIFERFTAQSATGASNKAGLASSGGGPHDPGMEARVAKLEAAVEHIQRDLADVKADLRAFKGEVGAFRTDVRADFKEVREEFKSVRSQARTDFLILAGMIIAVALGLAGLMAKGFKWL